MTKALPRRRRRTEKETPSAALLWSIALGSDQLSALGTEISEADAEAKLVELWNIHKREALAAWTKRFGTDDLRPPAWWRHEAPGRLPVPPSNGSGEDNRRFKTERRKHDIIFLIRAGLLTPQEKKLLKGEIAEIAETEIWEP